MAIIYVTVSLRQALQGQWGPPPVCPVNGDHRMVRNGQYGRHGRDRTGSHRIIIQRSRCQDCAVTYSALPYDCRPYTAHTWPLVLALGWVWPRERHWTWARCQQWLTVHHLDLHLRTMQRWAARWRAGESCLITRAIQWIAQTFGTREIPVWPKAHHSRLDHWRALWKSVVAASAPTAAQGGWLAGSTLWGWIPITFFAGLASPTGCSTLSMEVTQIHDTHDSRAP